VLSFPPTQPMHILDVPCVAYEAWNNYMLLVLSLGQFGRPFIIPPKLICIWEGWMFMLGCLNIAFMLGESSSRS